MEKIYEHRFLNHIYRNHRENPDEMAIYALLFIPPVIGTMPRMTTVNDNANHLGSYLMSVAARNAVRDMDTRKG